MSGSASYNCQLLVAIASYKWQLPVIGRNCQLQVPIVSYCEELPIILLFKKSEIWKKILHNTNKRVKFFMADTSHRKYLIKYYMIQKFI